MDWLGPASAVTLVTCAALTAELLARRQWILRWNGYDLRVDTSLIRTVMSIDKERVSETWHLPRQPADLHALVEDPQYGMIAFRAQVAPGPQGMDCRIFINGDWMGGNLPSGTRTQPAPPALQDSRWESFSRMAATIRELCPGDQRTLAAVMELEDALRYRLASHKAKEHPAALEEEMDAILGAARDLQNILRTDQRGEPVLAALVRAETAAARFAPPPPQLVTRTIQLKAPQRPRPLPTAEHSGKARTERRIEHKVSLPPTQRAIDSEASDEDGNPLNPTLQIRIRGPGND